MYEETGYDFTPLARPEHYIEVNMHDHRIRLYIVVGVDENTYFCPRTRKEISVCILVTMSIMWKQSH